MSIAGPLCALGFALFFAGLYLALSGRRLFDDCALMALGAGTTAMAYELMSKGI